MQTSSQAAVHADFFSSCCAYVLEIALLNSWLRVLLTLQRLFRYISGNNVGNVKISMTAPVITFVKPTADFKSAEKNYTVAFYLPQQFQVCSCRSLTN